MDQGSKKRPQIARVSFEPDRDGVAVLADWRLAAVGGLVVLGGSAASAETQLEGRWTGSIQQ
jgi:hypothetical protein